MTSYKSRGNCLVYKGSNAFRMRLLLSLLSGRPVKIEEIRSLDDYPGLREYEVNLIRLIDKISNGTIVELNHTGTSLYFQPGLLYGGDITHECCKLRAISYYLEVLLALGPFCKKPLNCVLTGVTNGPNEVSVDSMISGVIPILQKFLLVNDGLSLKVTKRGMAPEGGGQVIFTCPVRKSLKPIQVLDMGKVKRIRGVVYAAKMSPAVANRMVESAKGVLLNFIPDIYINTDHCKGENAGKSPVLVPLRMPTVFTLAKRLEKFNVLSYAVYFRKSFGISLAAETTTGVFLICDKHSAVPGPGFEPSVPEDLGTQAANLLLEEIYRGGCISSSFQSLGALWMALTQKDVSKLMVGCLSPYTIKFLQHLQDFFGLTFKLDTVTNEDEELNEGATKVLLTCLGIGYSNISKRML